MPFDIENSTEGYELAKATLMSPLDSTEVDLKEEKSYMIFTVESVTELKVTDKET